MVLKLGGFAPDFFLDVTDYGAVGDGTTDDTTAIQNAITAAAGMELVFPQGTYAITAKLTVSASNTVLRFSRGSVLKAITGFPVATMIQLGDGSTVYTGMMVFGPGKLDGNSLAQAGVTSTGPNTNIRVEGLEVTGTTSTGIDFRGVSAANPTIGCVAHGNYTHDSGQGIQAVWATDVQIIGNRVADMTSQDCIEVDEVLRFVISDNLISGPAASNSCIDIFEDCHDGTVTGNVCRRATGSANTSGIDVNHNTNANSRIVIADNTITGGFGSGIGVRAPAAEIIIRGNVIHDIDAGGGVGKGLEIGTGSGAVSHIKIIGNTVARTASFAIQLQNTADSVHVVDNTFLVASITTTMDVQAGVTNCWIAGNDFSTTGTVTNHILNAAGAGILVENNRFRGTASGGVIGTPNDSGLTARRNSNFITENSGTATINSGATATSAINHGLSKTPSAKHFSVIATEDPTNTPGVLWISSITSTQFVINCENDPGASNLDVAWKVEIV